MLSRKVDECKPLILGLLLRHQTKTGSSTMKGVAGRG